MIGWRLHLELSCWTYSRPLNLAFSLREKELEMADDRVGVLVDERWYLRAYLVQGPAPVSLVGLVIG